MLLLALSLFGLTLSTVSSNDDPFHTNKGKPTVFPVEGFNPQKDAAILNEAIAGWGTDEDAIVDVLGRRTLDQRLEIARQYKDLYRAEVIADLVDDLGSDLKNLAVALMSPLPQLYARQLHDAIYGLGTDEGALAEILGTLNNNAIQAVKQVYETMYNTELEDDLEGDTWEVEGFKDFIVSLSAANRDENDQVDPKAAAMDARALRNAAKKLKDWVTPNETIFNSILVSRSYPQLRLIFQKYEKLAGMRFEEIVTDLFNGDLEIGYLAIAKYAKNKTRYFAERLHDAMAGPGTNDRTLIRIIVARSEIDLGDIKDEYERMYRTSLKKDIIDDTSGEYQQLLLLLVEG